MAKPRVLLVPHFRRMDEIFDKETLLRLEGFTDVVWGRDGPMPQDEFEAAMADVHAVVFGTWEYDRSAIRIPPDLRVVMEVAGGHRHPELDHTYLSRRSIPFGSCAPAFGPAVAEMALALTLAANRKVVESDRDFRLGVERYLHEGNEGSLALYGRKVGFVGCGGLARSLQPLLIPFGVEILGYDPGIDGAELAKRGISPVDHLDDILGVCDLVYVLAAPTDSNRHLLSRRHLERLRPNDLLVLMSRAHLVDFDALTELVLAERFRAAIDVFPTEPLPGNHPIRQAQSAVLSAHLAGALPEALQEIGRMVTDDLEAILHGGVPSRMQYATSNRGGPGPG